MQVNASQPINVFLVDDHRTVLWGLERLIESAAPQMSVVGKAETCEELLDKLANCRPDVILLDLDLGGSSSIERLDDIAAQSTARVLILTGSSDPSVHQHAVVRGARGVVHKQVGADTLLRAIEKVHEGEIWLDRRALSHVMTTLSIKETKSPKSLMLELLTAKEWQIVNSVVAAKCARTKIIAEKLHMSEHTMRNHLTVIYEKLQVEGRMELYLFAVDSLNLRVAA